jgi:hypothetical protein
VYITDKNHPLGLHWISEDTGIYWVEDWLVLG